MSNRPLRIAVDARTLNTEHLRGIGKSVYELIKRAGSAAAIDWRLFADRPDRPMQVPDEACDVSIFETRGYRFHTWEQWSLPRAAQRCDADVLHAPATSMPWWQPLPTVVTIHDTIPWQQRDHATTSDFYRDRVLPAAYHRAAAIMTVSNTSRRDILARWPALKPKLHVVSPGVDERYLEAQVERRPLVIDGKVLAEPYFLYLGGGDPRKRLMWALQSWWSGAGAKAMFVVCGLEAAAHAAIRRSVPRELQDRLVLAHFVSEADMPQLYMRAAAVLYPSLYEGFGLPVIEAQAVGTPVLFSAVGSLAELNGPGAIILPVDDLDAWVRTVANILATRTGQVGPDRIARAWARQYSWDAYVDRTLAVYASAAERHAATRGDRHLHQGATS